MPSISSPPPFEETIAFLRNSPPPGEYSRIETEKRRAARALQKSIDAAFTRPDEAPLALYYGPPAVKKKRRQSSYLRIDPQQFVGKPCPYCEHPMDGVRFPTRDHIQPRALGGRSSKGNILVVCRPCNGNKGARTLEQFAQFLTEHGDPRAAIVWKLLESAPSRPLTKRRLKTIPLEETSKYVLRGGFWVEK